jgi:hypothetical protein
MRNFNQQTPTQSFCVHHFPPFSILSEQVDASREASRASMIGYFNPEPSTTSRSRDSMARHGWVRLTVATDMRWGGMEKRWR